MKHLLRTNLKLHVNNKRWYQIAIPGEWVKDTGIDVRKDRFAIYRDKDGLLIRRVDDE